MAEKDSDLIPFSSIVQCGWTECSEMANLRACSQCKNQWYCCVEHQKLHWKVHKPLCKTAKKVVKEASSSKTDLNAKEQKKPDLKLIERYRWTEMPTDIESLYALRKEMTIRHGYNMMNQTVDEFYEAMRRDSYPSAESEGIFGIQMEPKYERYDDTTRVSMGNLVFLVWVAMWKAKFPDHTTWKNEIVMMILMGKFPEWFQLEVLEYVATKEGSKNAYVHELLERGVENIKYDILLLRFRWGEITEKDIAFLTKTAS